MEKKNLETNEENKKLQKKELKGTMISLKKMEKKCMKIEEENKVFK